MYAAKAGWDELDPTDYETKAQVVSLMEKSISDAEATVKSLPDDSFTKTLRRGSASPSTPRNTMACWSRTIGRMGWCHPVAAQELASWRRKIGLTLSVLSARVPNSLRSGGI